MPEIALGGLSALDAPPGLGRPGRKSSSQRKRQAGPRLRKFRAHAALVVGSATFSAIMIGIVLNATVMQKEHHPAPLFAPVAAPVTPAPARFAAPVPLGAPVAAPADAAPAVSQVAPAAEAPRPKPKAAAMPHHAAPHAASKGGDAIGRLLGSPAAHDSGAHPAGRPAHATIKATPVVPVSSSALAPPAR